MGLLCAAFLVSSWGHLSTSTAYQYAMYAEQGRRADTLEAALKSPKWAFYFALSVDKAPREDTREAAIKAPEWAYKYALEVEKGWGYDTRKAASKSPEWAYLYASNIDLRPMNDTRDGASKDPKWAAWYHEKIEYKPKAPLSAKLALTGATGQTKGTPITSRGSKGTMSKAEYAKLERSSKKRLLDHMSLLTS